MLINMNNSTDNNYRYTMNEIELVHSGKHHLKFTELHNIKTIANQLNHNYKTLIKYIANHLGTTCDMDKLWLVGHHDKEIIQKHIFNFISTFIMCNKCSIPELSYKDTSLKKNKSISTHCLGCGHNDSISADVLCKTNKKILDMIIHDINTNLFHKTTKNIHQEDSFKTEEFI